MQGDERVLFEHRRIYCCCCTESRGKASGTCSCLTMTLASFLWEIPTNGIILLQITDTVLDMQDYSNHSFLIK